MLGAAMVCESPRLVTRSQPPSTGGEDDYQQDQADEAYRGSGVAPD